MITQARRPRPTPSLPRTSKATTARLRAKQISPHSSTETPCGAFLVQRSPHRRRSLVLRSRRHIPLPLRRTVQSMAWRGPCVRHTAAWRGPLPFYDALGFRKPSIPTLTSRLQVSSDTESPIKLYSPGWNPLQRHSAQGSLDT